MNNSDVLNLDEMMSFIKHKGLAKKFQNAEKRLIAEPNSQAEQILIPKPPEDNAFSVCGIEEHFDNQNDAELFLCWLAFRGYPNESLFHEERAKIFINNEEYHSGNFLMYLEKISVARFTFPPIYINRKKLPKMLQHFFDFLNFEELEEGSGLYNFNNFREYSFGQQYFRQEMQLYSLPILHFLDQNCYIRANKQNWREHLILNQDLKFYLSHRLIMSFMETAPEKNKLTEKRPAVYKAITDCVKQTNIGAELCPA